MKYIFLTYVDEQAWANLGEAEQQRRMAECVPHWKDLVATGKFLDGAPLHPTATATTIRNRGGKRLVTDGPFAEAREQIGGYTLVNARDLDEAIAMANGFLIQGSIASIEIRPVVEINLPA